MVNAILIHIKTIVSIKRIHINGFLW